jgi:cell division protein FtsZ
MDFHVKLIGCGGGGSNAVHRCTEVGIQGVEMCAIDTDVKHLLMIHAGM